MNKALNNLLKEKYKYIGVDIDNTLCEHPCFTIEEVKNAEPKIKTIQILQKLSAYNAIIIYTRRPDNLIPATLEWLRKNNIRFDYFSNNKPYFDIYIGDEVINIKDL